MQQDSSFSRFPLYSKGHYHFKGPNKLLATRTSSIISLQALCWNWVFLPWFGLLLCKSIKGFISGMQSNRAITVIYLCSLRENHFTEAVLHLTKPNRIVTPAFNGLPGSGSHQGIWMAFPNKTLIKWVLYSKWTVKVLAQDQFLLYMPLKLFYLSVFCVGLFCFWMYNLCVMVSTSTGQWSVQHCSETLMALTLNLMIIYKMTLQNGVYNLKCSPS